MKKCIVHVFLALLLLALGQTAQADAYELPDRVHALAACGDGALVLIDNTEIFRVAQGEAAAPVTAVLPGADAVYLADRSGLLLLPKLLLERGNQGNRPADRP